ncbi:hypothetical protein [Streptomyces milbemycinicus]|uniref:Uncharacterized protein n=1 Tax=Streptomyces milbemycinicus TaxID=476552 RepID=A0ABW8LWJ6_9ACTN
MRRHPAARVQFLGQPVGRHDLPGTGQQQRQQRPPGRPAQRNLGPVVAPRPGLAEDSEPHAGDYAHAKAAR